jgi:hypothetical protein
MSDCRYAPLERFVGAGLALPLQYADDVQRGQGKPSPYETRGLRLRRPSSLAHILLRRRIELVFAALGAKVDSPALIFAGGGGLLRRIFLAVID